MHGQKNIKTRLLVCMNQGSIPDYRQNNFIFFKTSSAAGAHPDSYSRYTPCSSGGKAAGAWNCPIWLHRMDTTKFPSLLLNDAGIIPEIFDVRFIGKDVVPPAIPFPYLLGGNMAAGCSETSTHSKLQDVTLHKTAVNMETSAVSCFGGSCFTSPFAISCPEI